LTSFLLRANSLTIRSILFFSCISWESMRATFSSNAFSACSSALSYSSSATADFNQGCTSPLWSKVHEFYC
jgi:hypothetical protein